MTEWNEDWDYELHTPVNREWGYEIPSTITHSSGNVYTQLLVFTNSNPSDQDIYDMVGFWINKFIATESTGEEVIAEDGTVVN